MKEPDNWTQVVEMQLGRPTRLPEPAGLQRLLRGCKGQQFDSIRDRALIRILLYSGVGVTELAKLTLNDIDFVDEPPLLRVTNRRMLRIMRKELGEEAALVEAIGKTVAFSVAPLWGKAEQDLKAYLALRQQHQYAHSPGLWLDGNGQMGVGQITRAIQRRARDAGMSDLNARTLKRYSRLWADERALRVHRRLSPIALIEGDAKPPKWTRARDASFLN